MVRRIGKQHRTLESLVSCASHIEPSLLREKAKLADGGTMDTHHQGWTGRKQKLTATDLRSQTSHPGALHWGKESLLCCGVR